MSRGVSPKLSRANWIGAPTSHVHPASLQAHPKEHDTALHVRAGKEGGTSTEQWFDEVLDDEEYEKDRESRQNSSSLHFRQSAGLGLFKVARLDSSFHCHLLRCARLLLPSRYINADQEEP
jgi:hypothetical protein